jgi:hypothetical protein
MKNIDDVVKLIKADARDAFSRKADQDFCNLLDYAYEFRKKYMEKKIQAFS